MNRTVGACSLCGGRVVVPAVWLGVNPPIPECESCRATPRRPHGPVIEMEEPSAPPHIPDFVKR